jgi:hypothetical protein
VSSATIFTSKDFVLMEGIVVLDTPSMALRIGEKIKEKPSLGFSWKNFLN